MRIASRLTLSTNAVNSSCMRVSQSQSCYCQPTETSQLNFPGLKIPCARSFYRKYHHRWVVGCVYIYWSRTKQPKRSPKIVRRLKIAPYTRVDKLGNVHSIIHITLLRHHNFLSSPPSIANKNFHTL